MKAETAEQRLTGRQRYYRMYEQATKLVQDECADGTAVRLYAQPNVTGELRYYLIAFAGTSGKPAAHVSYRDEGRARVAAAQFLDGRKAHAERVAFTRTARRRFQTTLEPGRILVNTWGYDQTNVDYYQVVEVSPSRRSVVIRKIAARSTEEGWLQGSCWPLADEFIGSPMLKRVGEGESVKIHDWGSWARPWTPKADHWTAYH